MATLKSDVVIVGAGAAGGIIAAELAKAGMKVIALERGPRLKTLDFAPQDELRYFQRQDLRPDPKRQPVTWRANTEQRARPINTMSYGNQAGGGTVHYGAVSWRLHEDDFKVRTSTIERYGEKALPEGASIIDWPLSYAELEPYYDRAEYELGVSGKAGNLQGRKIAGGNPFEAPRRREFPLPALRMDQAATIFDKAARNLGLNPFSTPRAILSQPYKDRPGCSYCGFCQAFGCHIGAKSSILVTKLPEADATGNFKLLANAMAYRINSDNSGKATGVAYWGPDGSENTIEAEIVVLTPFIYDTTRLLLLSKTAKHPDGLANSSGLVGKFLMTHIRGAVFVAFDNRKLNVYMGPNAQKHTVDDWGGDNFDHKDLGFIRGSQISIGTVGQQGGPIGAAIGMSPPPGVPRWGAAYRDFFAKHFDSHASIGMQVEDLPYINQTIDLDPNVRDMYGLPAPRMTYDWRRPHERKHVAFIHEKMEQIGRAMGAKLVWRSGLGNGAPGGHHEGGARMGADPKTSVVNKYGQSWDVPNLFMVGSASFPTMSQFNPTLTIQALAYMTAEAIATRYRKSPGALL